MASGALVIGRNELLPGADVAVSVILPIPTAWWFRPVSNACLVGSHNAVVWNRLYLSPPAASRSAVGVRHGPPNTLDAPKPTSSSSTISTLGAPSGGSNGSIGGNAVSGSFASYVVRPGDGRSGIGNIVRACRSALIRLLAFGSLAQPTSRFCRATSRATSFARDDV